MNVLHVSAAAERGGLEVMLLNTIRALDRSRFSGRGGPDSPESFSVLLLETMALDKPVVATDLGGPREIVDQAALRGGAWQRQ